MTLLVLGGTSEALMLTQKFIQTGIEVVYSIAGKVRQPDLACTVLSGGFRQYGDLASVIRARHITAILDVTHPYAQIISQTAKQASIQTGIPYWQYARPAWQPEPNDRWSFFPDWDALLSSLYSRRIFVTTGQLEKSLLDVLMQRYQQVFVRTAVMPAYEVPKPVLWINDIGPFSEQSEQLFMQQHRIDTLITKNSGGNATVGKIRAARNLGVDVCLLQRPELPRADQTFSDIEVCKAFICRTLSHYPDPL